MFTFPAGPMPKSRMCLRHMVLSDLPGILPPAYDFFFLFARIVLLVALIL